MTDRRAGEDGPPRRKRPTPLEGSPADVDEVPGWTGRIMVWMRVAAQLVAIQLLMIAGTLLGLVVAGLGPATTAGSLLLRRLVDGDASTSLWKDYWGAYRAHFRRAALVTAPFILVIALAWYESAVLLAYGNGAFSAVLAGAVLAAGCYAIACLGYAPHVLRRYEDPTPAALRFVALAPLLSPLTALGCIVTGVALGAIGLRWPVALVLVGLSLPMLLTGLLVDRWLDKVEARAEKA